MMGETLCPSFGMHNSCKSAVDQQEGRSDLSDA